MAARTVCSLTRRSSTDIFTCDDLSVDYDSDLRDPSRYFMVFETGDNTTVEVGEAEPLDLFYGRAESFGDDYVVWTETDTGSTPIRDCLLPDRRLRCRGSGCGCRLGLLQRVRQHEHRR